MTLPKLPTNLEELYIYSNPLNQITSLPLGLEIIGVSKDINKDILDPEIHLNKNLLILS